MNDLSNLDKILKRTIDTISDSKNKICEIADSANKEYLNLEKEYEVTKESLRSLIKNTTQIEQLYKKEREEFISVNKNFNSFSEEEKRNAYLKADELRIQIAVNKEREQMLISIRNDLEIRLKLAKETIEKAENLINHVGIAMNFLNGNLNDLSTQITDINNKHLFAIKILEMQEIERKKIARDIHDGIAQTISNIVIKTEICNKFMQNNNISEASDELITLKEVAKDALDEIRAMIYDLRPMSLDDLGLVPTLERYIDKVAKDNNLKISLKVKGPVVKLKSYVEVVFFRIVQEALNNTIKHAQAHEVLICLNFSEQNIELSVKDDGIGFNPQNIELKINESNSGYGLIGMKERITSLGGEFIIKSKKNKGTTCIAKLEI